MKYCFLLKDIKKDKNLLETIGGKAYSLLTMLQEGFNVPNGAVVTSAAYSYYISYNKIHKEIRSILVGINEKNVFLKSQLIKEKITSGKVPQALKCEIERVLLLLKSNFLAIRSSAVSEDILDSSFAGMHDSYLGVKKDTGVILDAIKKCWASLYNPNAIFYRLEKGLNLEGKMCVIIQEMIPAKVSGIVFSSFPSQDVCTIESNFGLGNLIVSGKVEPDVYVVRKKDMKIIKKTVGKKNKKTLLTSNGVITIDNKEKENEHSLTDEDAISITKQACLLEHLFGKPQDIEWAICDKKLFILQSRPFKLIKEKKLIIDDFYSFIPTPIISGVAFKIKNGKNSIPPKESVLIIDSPKPQYVSFLKNVKAVVCEEGGILNHFAIVCRELGIPFLVLEDATKLIKDGEWIEINIKQPSIEPKQKIRQKWIKIMSYIPSPPDIYTQNLHRKITQNLPTLINKKYLLDTSIKSTGIFISKISLDKFIDDVKQNINCLYENIRRYNIMPDEKKLSIAILASIIVSPLFDMLTMLTKDRNIALSLIRGKYAFYLELEGTEPYLMRFGVANAKIRVPEEFKNKLQTIRVGHEKYIRKISRDTHEARKIKILASTLKLLIKAYEEKNKLVIKRR
jgi:pyruvate,water dikinase